MSNIIDLVLSRSNVVVWNAKDWLTLRKDYRIMGELLGCLPKKPRQDIFLGLPLLLLPEEVTLLLEKKLARVVQYPGLQEVPSVSLKQTYEEYKQTLFVEQEECLKQQRKKQVIMMMDKIVDGKRRKMLGIQTTKKKMKKQIDMQTHDPSPNIDINTDELLKQEMAKIPKLDKSEALVQIHTAYPWSEEKDIKLVEWKYPSTANEKLRYKIFKDLWEQGYYVTSGEKFGGDFLAYPGDPIMFHSQFIVQCKMRDEELSVPQLIGQCRIGCHVRKTQVFATLAEDDDNVKYQSFQWADTNLLENG